jgi:subtilisin-like proprotein convertase family protein
VQSRVRAALIACLSLVLASAALLAPAGGAAPATGKAAKKKRGKARSFQNANQTLIPDRPPGATSFVGLLDSRIRIGKAMKGKLVADVDVRVRITHSDLSDLDIYLIAPNGTKVFLTGNHDGIDNSATTYGTGPADCTGAPTTFNDETQNFISDSTTGVVVQPGQIVSPWAATVQPEGFPLSVIDGSKARGPWTLRVEDFVSGGTGTLDCWSVRIKSRNRR